MTAEQLQHIRRRFLIYVDAYIARAGKMQPMMKLKREHCAFVAKNARELAERNGWEPPALFAAEALGLLHDIGRFPQLEEYGTFRDECSIHHGLRGMQVIQEEQILDGIDEPLQKSLLLAVRYHNDRELNRAILPEALPWLKLIRDADRLDIYRVIIKTLQDGEVEKHPDVVLHLELNGPPSPRILKSISQHEPPAYADLHSVSDFLLMILSWTHQMEMLPAAHEIMFQRNIIENLTAFLPDRPEIKSFLASLPTQNKEQKNG